MTRIIGGSAGGRRLRTPTGDGTRPTSDRVREALFSAIESATGSMTDRRFLDLYAGSGAVGLEALSRGAAAATLVERDRSAAAVIRGNAATLGLPAEVVTSSVPLALRHRPRSPYDIVFLDPPYSTTATEVGLDLTTLRGNKWLTHEALVIVERPTRERGFAWPEGYREERSKRYGETTLWYGHAAGPTRGG